MTVPEACPTCGGRLTRGWIALWNPILGQKVRWQEPRPGYVRLRIPTGASVVLKARPGGKDARQALRCGACATTVIPPDVAYDG